MKTPQPPAAPNPTTTANTQSQYNTDAARDTQRMNMVDQNTPQGSLKYNQSGTWEDGSPRYSADVSLSADQQALQNRQNSLQTQFGNVADAQLGRASDTLSTPFRNPSNLADPKTFQFSDYQGAVGGLGAMPQFRNNLGAMPQFQNPNGAFDPSGTVTDRKRVEDALFERLNPQLDRSKNALENRLMNSGLNRGSEAWDTAIGDENAAANDARLATIDKAGQEQQRLFNQLMSQRQQTFGEAGTAYDKNLAARGQQFGENVTGYGQNLTARGQQLNEAMLPYQMAGSDFDRNLNLRQQQMQEALTERGLPLEELGKLMGYTSTQGPQFQNTPTGNVQAADYTGAVGQQLSAQQAAYQAKVAQQNAMIGGLAGLGGTALGGWARAGFGTPSFLK